VVVAGGGGWGGEELARTWMSLCGMKRLGFPTYMKEASRGKSHPAWALTCADTASAPAAVRGQKGRLGVRLY
jgi:hypothetical protein